MKYTIEGFNQEFASTLKKDVVVRGKVVTKKIDCTDLVILRWFVDFFPKMIKVHIDDKEYALVTHSILLKELPIIDISKRSFIERMQKLVDFEILDYRLVKRGGTFSYYGFGKNYEMLISTGSMGIRSNDTGVCIQTDTGQAVKRQPGIRLTVTGADVQPDNKDQSTNNHSTIHHSINKCCAATTAHTRESDDGGGTDDDEDEDDADKLYIVDKKYHVVMLSDNQINVLLNKDKITLDEYDYYVDKLGAFIVKKGAHVKNHFQTIRDWIAEDRRTGGKNGQ